MSKRPNLALCIACLALTDFGCHGRDQTLTEPTAQDRSGTAGTSDGAPYTRGVEVGGGGTGGSSGELDDPFGIGPRPCDLDVGAGGDGCSNFMQTSGFHTEPEHLQTDVSPQTGLRVWVATEFSPTTALKQALEEGLQLREFGSDVELSFGASWVTEGLDTSETVRGVYVAVAYDLEPAQALTEGWYSLTIPRSARAALGASYVRFRPPPLLRGGAFVELETGDLRADFRVGSLPFLSRVKVEAGRVEITFSERVEAAVPPVTISNPTFAPHCAPEGWAGAGRTLRLTCEPGLGGPVRVSFGEGLKTASGTPLRGPGGAASFEVELLAEDTLELEMPAPVADAGSP